MTYGDACGFSKPTSTHQEQAGGPRCRISSCSSIGTRMSPLFSLVGCLLGLTITASATPAEPSPTTHSALEQHTPPAPEAQAPKASATALAVLKAAEAYLGQPYVFGGRLRKRACRSAGQRVACAPGIDCLSLLFFAFEEVVGRPWWRYSVTPTVLVEQGHLGKPVAGMNGILASELDTTRLLPGDILFFLMEGYNLEADGPLLSRDSKRYGTWHTGLFYGLKADTPQVLHAAPGDQVLIGPLSAIPFDAIYVMRVP
jgi:cell wall-associated NlpC family hydrolase